MTGAGGGIAQALLDELRERYHVRALFRADSAVSRRWEERGCTIVRGDISDEAALSTLVQGSTFVFHCAAAVTGSYPQAHAVNVDGTRALARAAAAHGCRRFVHMSSIAVYAGTSPRDGAFDEGLDLVEHPDMGGYSLTKLRSEKVLREAASSSNLSFVILRPTCVYGPHTKPYTMVPLEMIRKGLPVIVGDGQGLLDVIYVDDVARAMVLAAEAPNANGEVFNIGHQLLPFNEFYAYMGHMLHRPVRHLPAAIPRALMRLAERGPGPLARRLQSARKVASFLLRASENTSRYPSSKAAALLAFSPSVPVSAGMLATEVWARKQAVIGRSNFSLPGYGPLHFRPAALAHPETESDIVQMIGIAVRAEVPAKAIGSLHSLCPIPETDGVCLVLDRYNRLLGVTGTSVTVEAGMKLRDLHNHLAAHGVALPVSGSISEQTVSGAISTATHGGSIQYPALSDYVEAIRIVRADGTVVDLDQSHELFPAAVVSLGVLGVISTVTFRCVPAFQLESRSVVMTVPELIENFDALHRGSRYVSVVYFPIIDRVEVVTADLASAMPARGSVGGPKVAGSNGLAQRLALPVAKSAAWMLHRYGLAPVRRALASRSAGRFYQSRAGRSDHVLAVGDVEGAQRSPMTMQDMELAVRYEQATAALRALRDHFSTTRRYPLLPIHIRCASRSGQWMSPAYERDVCYFDFWQYPRSDAAFQEIYDVMDRFECRFHWGKETPADRQTIKARYPRWDDFARLRQEWDPRGVFLNAYMASFLGEPPGAARRE